jgi:hypothetical protein
MPVKPLWQMTVLELATQEVQQLQSTSWSLTTSLASCFQN